jgi:hypothetical protein
MARYLLITDDELSAFAAALLRYGFTEQDFELEENIFDQQTAEVESRKGDVGVKYLVTEAVAVYPLGDGSDWVASLSADLESASFNPPPK